MTSTRPGAAWVVAALLVAAAAAASEPAPAAGAAGLAEQAASALVAVFAVTRHGARNVLPKSSTLKESEATGGPTLLPQGAAQCAAAGRAFRARYLAAGSCGAAGTCLPPERGAEAYGVLGGPGVGFHNYNTFAASSSLDRTLKSAAAFWAGAFPAAAGNASQPALSVPVYTDGADVDDWRVRGYTKCPSYARRLESWLGSAEFRAKEEDTASLRAAVQALAPQLNTSLANWWNVYDAFNVWRTFGVGDAQPAMDDATFNQTVELAMWLETRKMRPALAGSLLGGALLADLLSRLQAAAAAAGGGGGSYYRLLGVSAHYNTQLGLLAALQQGGAAPLGAPYPWEARIPALAAVLAFELHALPRGAGFAVRAVAQDGPARDYVALALPCAEAGGAAEAALGAGACSLDAFARLAGPQAFSAAGDWCAACDNDDVLACRLSRAERLLAEAPGPGGGAGGGGAGARRGGAVAPGMVALWCVVAVALAAALAGGALLVARRARASRERRWAAETVASGLA
ncbi:Acp2 [Scenedesmus sp. PABB004]|nr:Acp2 [Scenedesmus sp. PABB004]